MKRRLLTILTALLCSIMTFAQNINFADSKVKEICVAHWDTNGDGELSYEEATAVENIEDYFVGNKQITSFDEFQYFTGITKITVAWNPDIWEGEEDYEEDGDWEYNYYVRGGFMGCSNLESIVFPNSITHIEGDYGDPDVPDDGDNGLWFVGPFSGCKNLKKLQLPNSLTTIGDGAFCDCRGVTSVYIPNSVTSIGIYAFNGCDRLTNVFMDNPNPLGIDKTTFSNRANATLVVPIGCKSAYEAAEYWKEFKQIIENDNVIDFADANVKKICVAHWDTNGDGELSFEEAAAVEDIEDFFVGKKEITSFDEFQYFTGIKKITVAFYHDNDWNDDDNDWNDDDWDYYYVSGGFMGCSNLKSIVFPNTITYIGGDYGDPDVQSDGVDGFWFVGPFSGCKNLKTLQLPKSLTIIGNGAFCDCWGVTNVYIPNSVTSIGIYAFYGCDRLTNVFMDNPNPMKIDKTTFPNCANATLYVPEGCSTTYKDAGFWREFMQIFEETESINFADAKVKAICVENWDTNSDGNISSKEVVAVADLNGVFSYSDITLFDEFQYFTGMTSIRDFNDDDLDAYDPTGDFEGCSNLRSIIIPKSVINIGDGAFRGCSNLTSIDIHSKVQNIGNGAFRGCNKLTDIIIPSSVKNIGNCAFMGCSDLTEVTVKILNPLTIDKTTFSNRANATLFVPKGSKFAYEEADYWKEFKQIIEIENDNLIDFADANVKAICVANWDTDGDGELSYEEAAAVADIGNSFVGKKEITTFDEFQYFTGVTYIQVDTYWNEDDEYEDEDYAYYDLYAGSDYKGGFMGCTNLKSIVLPKSLEIIGPCAFAECSSLISIEIPYSVTRIGEDSLEPLPPPGSYGDFMYSIGAFQDCPSLSSIHVDLANPTYDSRDNCNAIIETATNELIAGCKNSVIPSDVYSIGINAFFGSSWLTSIVIPNSVKYIGGAAFQNCPNLISVTVEWEEPLELEEDPFDEEKMNNTLYVPVGTKDAYEAADIWKEFGVIVEIEPFIKGDVNHDNYVNMSDVTSVISYIQNKAPSPFYMDEADVNGDKLINISDVTAIIGIILSEVPADVPDNARYATIDDVYMQETDNGCDICLVNTTNYIACEMTLQLPEDCSLRNASMSTIRSDGHLVFIHNQGDGLYRLAVYSENNNAFIDGEPSMLHLTINGTLGDNVRLYNILFIDDLHACVAFPDVESIITGINGVDANSDNISTYNLQGIPMLKDSRGVHVRKGSKFVVK